MVTKKETACSKTMGKDSIPQLQKQIENSSELRQWLGSPVPFKTFLRRIFTNFSVFTNAGFCRFFFCRWVQIVRRTVGSFRLVWFAAREGCVVRRAFLNDPTRGARQHRQPTETAGWLTPSPIEPSLANGVRWMERLGPVAWEKNPRLGHSARLWAGPLSGGGVDGSDPQRSFLEEISTTVSNTMFPPEGEVSSASEKPWALGGAED